MERERNLPQNHATKTYARTYDKSAKNVIATRQFLAMILHERVPEFQSFSLDIIERDCIEGTPWVEEIPVDPGRTNGKRPQKIRGLSAEQSEEDEGYITYDVLFYARVPGSGKRIKLLINIEAQRNNTDYDLFHRAWFYLCRLVSSQKERDFSGEDYDSICKVYSIWLCFYLPEGEKSSISSYRIHKDDLVGCHEVPESIYDLMRILMIHVGDDENADTLLKFLRLVFLSELTEGELSQKLQDEFGMQPNDETRKELTNMCNLSLGLTERAEARGEAHGTEKTWITSARNLMKNLKLTAQQAVDAIAVPEAYRAKVLEQL
ncbi:nuclease [uncultured Selenomonas sp.]|uniref:nuclease n=1 Tax=uncultured Selenomonas sp. TaxID=159275 RepID=UPI0025E5E171|nr:nuclease [uncultured Selenomonas sp.]